MYNERDKKIIVQIYEIQNPQEAEELIQIGVDHIGSVIVSETDWKVSGVRDTMDLVSSSSAKSSLILLFNSPDSVWRTLDYYQPDIVHFCEALTDHEDVWKRFPQIMIMRSIPIAQSGKSHSVPTLDFGKIFEPASDFFLTDTMLSDESKTSADSQPVQGFVGITGQTCCWHTAAELASKSNIPVILAGGISPDNVAQGIMQVRPEGVDSCTQTNSRDGQGVPIRFKKDFKKLKQLVSAVRAAEKAIAG
ncbi:MAG: hypothetical protein JRC59_04245 [Deltaproteobacteria bacterium]|nr:hypothetical protein [Deltaproteobacteria bacterium]